MIDGDPNNPCDNLRENLGKPDKTESDYKMLKMIVDEFLGTKNSTRKQYNGVYEKIRIDIKTEIIYLNNKMYCVQNRIFCGVCNKSVIRNNYSNHLKSQDHFDNVLGN